MQNSSGSKIHVGRGKLELKAGTTRSSAAEINSSGDGDAYDLHGKDKSHRPLSVDIHKSSARSVGSKNRCCRQVTRQHFVIKLHSKNFYHNLTRAIAADACCFLRERGGLRSFVGRINLSHRHLSMNTCISVARAF